MNPAVAFEPMPFVSFTLNALCPAHNFQSSLGPLAIIFSLMAQKHLWFSIYKKKEVLCCGFLLLAVLLQTHFQIRPPWLFYWA